MSTHPLLRRRWAETLDVAGLVEKPDNVSLIDGLIASYSEPHRKYHTCQHLEQCFGVLDLVFPGKIPNRAAVELALWYHDYVYSPLADNNEAVSGYVAHNIATVRLGASPQLAAALHVLILLTTHKPVEHLTSGFVLKALLDQSLLDASRILLDVDLSILGVPDVEFDAYEAQVRAEYAMIPEELFKPARANILAKFLTRPALYTTTEMKHREPQARANLNRSIAMLGYTLEEACALGKK